jgi:peroxisomal membrane protein 2
MMKSLLLFIAASSVAVKVDAFAPHHFSQAPYQKQLVLKQRHHRHRAPTHVSAVPEAIQQAWVSYNDALVAHPLLVKSLTAGVLLGAADLAGQAVQGAIRSSDGDDDSVDAVGDRAKSSTTIDFARTARFAFFGLVLQAPWNHAYYLLLDGTIPPTEDPWTTTTAVKTVIDQFVQAPIFTVLIFVFLGVLEGKNLDQIKSQLEDDYADTMVANWKREFT